MKILAPEYYVRTHQRGWSVSPSVLMDHRLMRRVSPFAAMSKGDHFQAVAMYRLSRRTIADAYSQAVTLALTLYGDGDGQLVSGVRDHFPATTKALLRSLAAAKGDLAAAAAAHWKAAGKRSRIDLDS